MEKEVDKWLEIIHQAWDTLLLDFENFGKVGGYGSSREEDIRSYLFCKIIDILRGRGEWLIHLHTEQPLPKKRADIVVGLPEDRSDEGYWIAGIEIKQSGQKKDLLSDLRKLHRFLRDGRIKIGILVTIAGHRKHWETKFQNWGLLDEFNLNPKDMEINNYFETRQLEEISLEEGIKKLDSVFFVLRKL